jgi:hypothetical protein
MSAIAVIVTAGAIALLLYALMGFVSWLMEGKE